MTEPDPIDEAPTAKRTPPLGTRIPAEWSLLAPLMQRMTVEDRALLLAFAKRLVS